MSKITKGMGRCSTSSRCQRPRRPPWRFATHWLRRRQRGTHPCGHGSALRRSIALIGPSLHIAARLLKHIPPGGIIATEAVVARLRQEAPALAQQFEIWDPCLILKGVEDECVSAFHLP